MDDPLVRKYVCRRLKRYWSPDQIAGRSQLEFRGEPRRPDLPADDLQWIHARPTEERDPWRRCLRFGRPRRKRREDAGRLPNAVRIDGRPAIVASRRRYGDWEGDTIVGRAHAGGLVSLVERKSGFTLLGPRQRSSRDHSPLGSRKNESRVLPESLRRTVTFDNGKEFAEHGAVSASDRHRRSTSLSPTPPGNAAPTNTPTVWLLTAVQDSGAGRPTLPDLFCQAGYSFEEIRILPCGK